MKTRSDRKKEEPSERSVTRGPDQVGSDNGDVQQRIAVRAYELYRERGCCDGHDLDDWLEAERAILISETTPEPSKRIILR